MIKLRRTSKGWTAVYTGIVGKPEGVAVPLPYTAKCGIWIVVSDTQNEFPHARIYAS